MKDILLTENSVKVTLFKCSLCIPLYLIVGRVLIPVFGRKQHRGVLYYVRLLKIHIPDEFSGVEVYLGLQQHVRWGSL